LIQVPLLAYNYLLFSRDPVWSQFARQNLTLSPPPLYFLFGLGLLLPFAALGGLRGIQSRSPAMGAMITWVVAGFMIAYLPVNIQRRFLLGMTIPLGILAVEGLVGMVKTKYSSLILFGVSMLVIISSIYLSLGSSIFIRTHPVDYFYPTTLATALTWLDDRALPDDYVMASARTGSITAQLTHLRVYIGHEMETIRFSEKVSSVEAYYLGNSPKGWLSTLPVRWVIFGPYEADLFGNFRPDDSLELVYDRDDVKIYEVISH
jgi:hypothetical protein